MLTIILLGMAKGILFSAVLLVVVMAEFFVPGVSRFEYHFDISLRMVAVYILISGITLVFETSRRNKDKINKKLTWKIMGINANLQNIVEERTQKIVKLQNSILKTMSNLVEYRDYVTGGHIERTQYGVNLLLDEIKRQKLFEEIINDWDMDLILQSVQLHDVGKIAISDLILNKPSQLTKEEYEEMKKHAVFGFKIIERMEEDSGESELLNHAKIFALTHHEKWDGTGYPHGLHGDNIPLQGRIMAVADVYDALISDRPYKKALSHEDAVRIMIDGRGTQFDPVLIDLFININNKLATCRT
jgi:putative two-component system response regulator